MKLYKHPLLVVALILSAFLLIIAALGIYLDSQLSYTPKRTIELPTPQFRALETAERDIPSNVEGALLIKFIRHDICDKTFGYGPIISQRIKLNGLSDKDALSRYHSELTAKDWTGEYDQSKNFYRLSKKIDGYTVSASVGVFEGELRELGDMAVSLSVDGFDSFCTKNEFSTTTLN